MLVSCRAMPAVGGQRFGLLAALEAPDVDAGHAHDAGHLVAVLAKLLEGLEPLGPQVALLTGDRLVEQVAGHLVVAGHVHER